MDPVREERAYKMAVRAMASFNSMAAQTDAVHDPEQPVDDFYDGFVPSPGDDAENGDSESDEDRQLAQ